MSVHLITGYAGKEHITSADQASFNASVFGEGNYVFNKGSVLKATALSGTAVSIADGDLILNGRHIRITGAETVNFDVGVAGLSRIDIIAIAYRQDMDTGVESAELKVIKGIPNTIPASPEVGAGEFALYKVKFNGFALEEIQQQFEIIPSCVDLFKNLQFALSPHELVLLKDSWEPGGEIYKGYYIYKVPLNVNVRNILEITTPFFMLNKEKAKQGDHTEYIDAETYFSMINLDIKKSERKFEYTFYSPVKPRVDIPIIIKGV